MTKEEIQTKVVGIVSDAIGVPLNSVQRETKLTEDLQADSLDIVEMGMEVEDTFDITISDEDYEKGSTVGDIIDYVHQRLESV